MSFTQGGAQRPLSLSSANVFVTGNSSVGNALTVQQLGVGAVASFLGSGGSGLFVDTIGRVGINTTTPGSNVQITGNLYVSNAITVTNLYVSNAITATNAYISNIYTSNIVGFVGSQWTGTTGQPIYYVPYVGVGSTTTPTSNVQITGNLYVSNAITVTNAYISNIYTSNITGVLLSQWTGTTGQPIYYVPQVGIGSSATPTSNVQITGNLYVSNGITTTNLIAAAFTSNSTNINFNFDTMVIPYMNVLSSLTTSNIQVTANAYISSTLYYNENITTRSPHIQPTPANASTIQGWISSQSNTVSQQSSFWAPASRPIFSNVSGGGTAPSSNAYAGSVALTDGRTVFIPYGASTFGVFNSATNQYSAVTPSGAALTPTSGWGNGLYFGGVQAPSGNIVCIPHVSGNIGVFEPEGYSFSNALAHNCPLGAFAGGVLDGNSNVTMIPYNSLNVCSYNGSTGLFSNMVQVSTTAPRLVGGVLLPTGNIIGIPFGTSNLIQYSPTARTFSNTIIGPGFFGGVLTPIGNVVCVPFTASNILVVNTSNTSNVVSTLYSNVTTGANGFMGGVLLPNGQIAFMPGTNSNVGLFNPTTFAFSNIVSQSGFGGANAYVGGSLSPDGRVIMCPSQASNVAVLNAMTPLPSQEFRLVPYLNKL